VLVALLPGDFQKGARAKAHQNWKWYRRLCRYVWRSLDILPTIAVWYTSCYRNRVFRRFRL